VQEEEMQNRCCASNTSSKLSGTEITKLAETVTFTTRHYIQHYLFTVIGWLQKSAKQYAKSGVKWCDSEIQENPFGSWYLSGATVGAYSLNTPNWILGKCRDGSEFWFHHCLTVLLTTTWGKRL